MSLLEDNVSLYQDLQAADPYSYEDLWCFTYCCYNLTSREETFRRFIAEFDASTSTQMLVPQRDCNICRHPYLLNVKIKPLQFAKNAIKGHLPLYNWRLVLRDLNKVVAEPGTQDASDLQSESDRSYQENKTVTASLASDLKDDWLEPAPETSRQKRRQVAA